MTVVKLHSTNYNEVKAEFKVELDGGWKDEITIVNNAKSPSPKSE